jgi:LemA protein
MMFGWSKIKNAMMAKKVKNKIKKVQKLQNLKAVTSALERLANKEKANTNFLELQRELSDTENKIQASRRFYNTNVRDFNTKLQVFPTNMIGNMLGFKNRDFFEAAAEDKENVNVSF